MTNTLQGAEPLRDTTSAARTPNQLLKFFRYEHLGEQLQEVSKPFGQLAQRMDDILPDGAEKTTALRKLLEAKDCAVRAILP